MTSYKVGYRRPPRDSQFKAGQSGNPSGRPKKKSLPIAECIKEVMQAPIDYRDRGRSITTTRHELLLRSLVARAQGGDLGAAETLLRIRERAEKHGDAGLDVLQIRDWLPDYEGQTAEQKAQGRAKPGMPPSGKPGQARGGGKGGSGA